MKRECVDDVRDTVKGFRKKQTQDIHRIQHHPVWLHGASTHRYSTECHRLHRYRMAVDARMRQLGLPVIHGARSK